MPEKNQFGRREFLVAAGLASASAALPSRAFSAQQRSGVAEIEASLKRWLKRHDVPGAALAVVRNGESPWIRAAGVRDRRTNAPVTDATVFQAASLSKPVFAHAVLTLAAEGKFDLDRPLTAYRANPWQSRLRQLMASEAPPGEATDPRLARVTARMVLRHASGLKNWYRETPLTLRFEPGRAFGYSGEAHVYLQNVVEHVTGQPLERFVEQRVLAPLGMESSSFLWRADYDERAAIGHGDLGPREKWRPRAALAAGTLHTTAADYAKFLAAMIWPQDGVGLNESWLRRMVTSETRIDRDLSWGLGWGLERHPIGPYFWQWGDDGEFKAMAAGSRETKCAAVVLTNGVTGLRVCRAVIEQALPGPHPFLSFAMLNY